MNEKALCTARELAIGYGKTPLLSDICLGAQPGQILTLIGPNGAGKSTLLKTLAGQLAPMGGTVLLAGKDLTAYTGTQRAQKLALMAPHSRRMELTTCFDFVSAGRYPYTGRLGILSAEDRQQVHRALELVGAAQLADRDFNRISDGQRQRILLARALCQQPEVILLDEPTSFLDIKGKIELLDAHVQSGNVPADRLTASVASLAAQVERLERYVAAMSGLQKLEDRAVVARPTRFDSVAGMVEDAGTGLAAHADRTFALSVSARCDRERPELCVDQAIVGEVAENLLNNAMRYASSQVDARLDVRDGALVLMVEDDGPGFSNAALERGCAPFFSEVPSAEHFGLGLNIASLMCEKHGGGVTLENREGGGARVVARFSLDFCAE